MHRYSESVDGRPQVTPAQVPLLVAQYLPWLKPTATNKMYNARLCGRHSPGLGIEPTGYPIQPAMLVRNIETMDPLLDAARDIRIFKSSATTDYRAYFGVSPRDVGGSARIACVGDDEKLCSRPAMASAADADAIGRLGCHSSSTRR